MEARESNEGNNHYTQRCLLNDLDATEDEPQQRAEKIVEAPPPWLDGVWASIEKSLDIQSSRIDTLRGEIAGGGRIRSMEMNGKGGDPKDKHDIAVRIAKLEAWEKVKSEGDIQNTATTTSWRPIHVLLVGAWRVSS